MSSDSFTESTDPYCLTGQAAAELLRPAPWGRFAVMGDSFAEGVGGPAAGYADVIWPERVAAALRATRTELAYLNTGRAGLRTAQVRAGQLDDVLAFKPDLVVIASGGNDLFGPAPALDAVESDLDAMYTAVREQGAHVVAFTVANVFDTVASLAPLRAAVAKLNERIRAVARRHDASLVEMWEHPVRLRPTVLSADGVHFSMQGQAVLASEIIKTLAGDLGSRTA